MKVLLFYSSHRQIEEFELSSRFFNLSHHLRHHADVIIYCDNDSISEGQLAAVATYNAKITIIKGKQVFASGTHTGISGNGIHIGLSNCFDMFQEYDWVINMVPDCYITDDSSIWNLLIDEMDTENKFIVDHHPYHNDFTPRQFACDFFAFKPKSTPNIFSEVNMNDLIPPESFIFNKIEQHKIPARHICRHGSLQWQVDNYGMIHNHDTNIIRAILKQKEGLCQPL